MMESMIESLFDVVKYDINGNFTSKEGCIDLCNRKYFSVRLPRLVYIYIIWFDAAIFQA